MADNVENRDQYPKHEFGIRKMELVRLIEGEDYGKGSGTSSVTLVKTPTSTVVMDSGSVAIREDLAKIMRENEAKIDKVNVLVTSVPDEKHSANDDLFVHCLQHVREGEWSNVPIKTNRRVAITTPDHWIDKFLRIVSLPFPDKGSLALIVHFPKIEELLEPSTQPYAGKTVGILGASVTNKDDPRIKKIIAGSGNCERPKGEIKTLEELVCYCDYVIPGFGPMFQVRE